VAGNSRAGNLAAPYRSATRVGAPAWGSGPCLGVLSKRSSCFSGYLAFHLKSKFLHSSCQLLPFLVLLPAFGLCSSIRMRYHSCLNTYARRSPEPSCQRHAGSFAFFIRSRPILYLSPSFPFRIKDSFPPEGSVIPSYLLGSGIGFSATRLPFHKVPSVYPLQCVTLFIRFPGFFFE